MDPAQIYHLMYPTEQEDIQSVHARLVRRLVKDPRDIQATLDAPKADLMHATFGICGEAGELLDAIKKHIVYDKPLDRDNVIEELGDLEFYLAQIRERLNLTRDEILHHNYAKLTVRYPDNTYTDAHAAQRLDKNSSG